MFDTTKSASTAAAIPVRTWILRMVAAFWSYCDAQDQSDTSGYDGLL